MHFALFNCRLWDLKIYIQPTVFSLLILYHQVLIFDYSEQSDILFVILVIMLPYRYPQQIATFMFKLANTFYSHSKSYGLRFQIDKIV